MKRMLLVAPRPGFGMLLTLSAALALLAAAGCSKAPPAQPTAAPDTAVPVSVAPVKLVPMDRTLEVVGTLMPKTEATVGAQVEGQVQKTLVDFGDRVVSGQELALIDTDSYDALAAQAEANLLKAKANLQNAESNLRRIIALQQQNISSASELDTATAQAEQARAEVKAVEAAANIAKLNLARSRARAPFDGGIAERVASPGDFVKVGAPLFRLVNDAELKFIVQAPERYAGLVSKGQLVEFTIDAFPNETFQGSVYLISPAIDTATRSFRLGALVANPDRKLKANSFARGELVLERGTQVPVIPVEAVLNFAGVTKVFVIQDNAARSREIKTGRVRDGYQEILAGLQPGEQVATTGTSKLYENARVRLLESTPQPTSTQAEPLSAPSRG